MHSEIQSKLKQDNIRYVWNGISDNIKSDKNKIIQEMEGDVASSSPTPAFWTQISQPYSLFHHHN